MSTKATPIPARLKKLSSITLTRGAHAERSEGMCAMGAAAWLVGDKHTDIPRCVNTQISSLVQAINDIGGDQERSRLIEYVPRLVTTGGVSARKVSRIAREYNEGLNRARDVLVHALGMSDVTHEDFLRTRDRLDSDHTSLRAIMIHAAGAMEWTLNLDSRLNREDVEVALRDVADPDEEQAYRQAFSDYIEMLFSTLDAMIEAAS